LFGLFYFNGNAQSVIVRRTLLFGSGRSQPALSDTRLLHQVIDSLRADGAVAILVEGHADSVGSRRTNYSLSRQRAVAVKKDLLRAGVSGSDIRVRAWGPDWPAADNQTNAGRQLNRRVDITFLVSAASKEPPSESREIAGDISDLYA